MERKGKVFPYLFRSQTVRDVTPSFKDGERRRQVSFLLWTADSFLTIAWDICFGLQTLKDEKKSVCMCAHKLQELHIQAYIFLSFNLYAQGDYALNSF